MSCIRWTHIASLAVLCLGLPSIQAQISTTYPGQGGRLPVHPSQAGEAEPPPRTPTATPVRPAGRVPVSQGGTRVKQDNYVLVPLDTIEITVYQEPDLSGEFIISEDGTINYPLVGLVRVGRLTIKQAAQRLVELLEKDFLVKAHVNMKVSQFASRRFTLFGQVRRPGSYTMPPQETLDLLTAVAMAGGYTGIADARKVTVKRVVRGTEQIIKVDGRANARTNDGRPFEVLPNDIITVGESLW